MQFFSDGSFEGKDFGKQDLSILCSVRCLLFSFPTLRDLHFEENRPTV